MRGGTSLIEALPQDRNCRIFSAHFMSVWLAATSGWLPQEVLVQASLGWFAFGFRFVSPATFRTILNLFPVFAPFFSPGKNKTAVHADLCG